MLVLGTTAKDKGGQLESLVHNELFSQGYVDVSSNVIGAGGNELDVVAQRNIELLTGTHVVPLVCEAKAYADPVDMPTWQKFLGKLFIQRAEERSTVGLLVALNGVNGNVRGSFASLGRSDKGIAIADGNQLLERSRASGEVAEFDDALSKIVEQFRRQPVRLEPAYYGAGFFWLAWWSEDEYSVVGGLGERLEAERVEGLRPALSGTVQGTLLAADEAQAQAEARHALKVSLLSKMFKNEPISAQELSSETAPVLAELAEETFCRYTDESVHLLPAAEMDHTVVAHLFNQLFANRTPVRHLDFMTDRHHVPYVARLTETLPLRQAGFELEREDAIRLDALAPYFPSVWVALSNPMPMIVTHRNAGELVTDEHVNATDRNEFWDLVVKIARDDFSNVYLRGLLYDHMGLAELEESVQVTFKTKQARIGSVTTETRTAIRQLADELVGEAGTRHALIRLLPTVGEPWEEEHPDALPIEGSDQRDDSREPGSRSNDNQ